MFGHTFTPWQGAAEIDGQNEQAGPQRTSRNDQSRLSQAGSISTGVLATTEKNVQFTSKNTESVSALEKKARLFSPAVASEKIAKQIAIWTTVWKLFHAEVALSESDRNCLPFSLFAVTFFSACRNSPKRYNIDWRHNNCNTNFCH